MLARDFVATLNQRYGSWKVLSEDALAAIRGHSWPGNVRELLHAVEAAFVVSEADEIQVEHLPHAVQNGPGMTPFAVPKLDEGRLPTLIELEVMHIRRALEVSHGHRGMAARALGISERNLYRKLKEYKLLG